MKKKLLQLKKYLIKLLHPIYFFPLKLITYTIYYLLRSIFRTLIYPFKSWGNFFRSLFTLGVIIYILASSFVIIDYLNKNYGYYGKFLCSFGTRSRLKNSVVRVVGGYSEGSGFFIKENQIITNFHVIADEPTPKIIFSDGSFTKVEKIVGDKDADIALLYLKDKYPDKVLKMAVPLSLSENEPLIAAGYPLGTDLPGKVTLLNGNFIETRVTRYSSVLYLQSSINLVEGMSGGPLVDQCGNVVGVNTLGLSGLSIFISSDSVLDLLGDLTDKDIAKIKVDPSVSPEEAVKAFYTYLKARRMEEGFKLLSSQYLQKTNFEEWTNRFTDILDVEIFYTKTQDLKNQIVFLKFGTKNWVGGEVEFHFYEGTWQTIFEDGIYKMLRSNIKEVENPDYEWFYEE
jgi:hypothetical protein